MLTLMAVVAFGLLLGAFPFAIVLIGTTFITALIFFPELDIIVLVAQIVAGIRPASLVCIPMFILAGDIMTSGEATTRLVNMVQSFLGHIPGGLPITTNAACTLFELCLVPLRRVLLPSAGQCDRCCYEPDIPALLVWG